MSVTVTVNGKSGPSVVATNGDTISAAVTKNAVVSVSASAAAAPGGTGPTGPQGPPSTTITVGNVSTLSAGSSATVVGTSSNNGANLSLAFGIPAGAAGATGAAGTNGTNGVTPTFSASATTLSAGSNATVTATTTNSGANVALAFGIPQGAAGSGGGATLSDATPSALGTASAGTSTSASRSDHTHGLPSLSTLGAAAANHAHNYVTAINNLTGALTLAGGSNVTLASNGSTITIAASGGSSFDSNATVDGGDYTGQVYTFSLEFTQQPVNQIASNGNATFSATAVVKANGSQVGVAPTYLWQRSNDSGATWANASSASNSGSLALTGLTSGADTGATFRALASASNAHSIYSRSSVLTFLALPTALPSGWSGSGTAASPWTTTTNFLQADLAANATGSVYVTVTMTINNNGGYGGIAVLKDYSDPFNNGVVLKSGTSNFYESFTAFSVTSGNKITIARNRDAYGQGLISDTAGTVTINSIYVWIA